MNFHNEEYKQINVWLQTIDAQRVKLEQCHNGLYLSPEQSQLRLTSIVTPASDAIAQTKATLTQIKPTLHAKEHMFYARFVQRFQQTVAAYQTELTRYKKNEHEGCKRQLRYLQVPEDQIEPMLQKHSIQDILKQSFISEELDDAVATIESRHQQIKVLESSIEELKGLFMDLAILVDQQGELINSIEYHVAISKDLTIDGTENLEVADDYNKSSRKKQCCIVILILTILSLIVAIPSAFAKA